MAMLDFAAIKAAYPIARVAELLELDLKPSNKQQRGKCPVCEGGGDRNLVITPEKGLYYCFSQGKGGDQLALVSHVKQVGVKEAAAWLTQDTPEEETKPKEKATPSDGFKALDYLDAEHDAVIALGLEPDVAQALGVGFAPRGVLRGTVAVPLRREDGTIAGYIGLTEIEKLPPKWHL